MYSNQDKARIFRERFFGRQDVFGVKWYSQKDDGKQISGYAPKCAKLWSDRCHLRLKDGIRCDSCEIKEYVPVSDETVLRHIHGEDQIIHYTLLLDNTVRFCALDFDMKAGKESQGYSWDDVSKAQQTLKGWGIPALAARSTTAGFHLYVFLNDFYPAYKMRSIMYWLFGTTGFMEQTNLGIRPLPEVFPKQSYNSPDGIGNGIKPPMVESRFVAEKNCLVDETNVMIGKNSADFEGMVAAQWHTLDTFPRISGPDLDRIIDEQKIDIVEDQNLGSGKRTYNTGMGGSRTSKWQAPLNGSIEKVLEGCKALRAVRDKALSGVVVGHAEGFALFHTCMATNDGIEWFKKNVPGWGQNDRDWKQLEHSVDKNYRPWTCRKMQENSVCAPKTQCFKPRPPMVVVEGQTVVLTDAPESEWIQPSPVRYAYGKGEDFLKKVMEEALLLKMQPEGEEKSKALKGLILRAQVFDEEQQKEFKTFLKEMKVARAGEVSKAFREGSAAALEAYKATIATREDVEHVHGNTYKKDYPFGYSFIKMNRGKDRIVSQLTDTDFCVEEVRAYTDDGKVVRAVYYGTCRTHGVEKRFELDSDFWEDNNEFKKYFGRLLNDNFNVARQCIDGVRQAAMAFSKKFGIIKTEYLITQGWYGDSYLMPSVVVDKDGVKPNTERKVDLSTKAFAKNFDFKILSDDECRSVLMHIKTDLLNTWPRLWTTIGLAHAMLPAVAHVLKLRQKPSLFFEGLTGAGKTELACALQWFWGNFEKVLNLKSSANGAMYEAYECKDALMVIDDYKGLDKHQQAAIHDLLHYGYDGTATTKLNRDGTPRQIKAVRCSTLATGEQFLSGEASVVARTILVEVNKHDTSKTVDSYGRCQERYPLYQGVTPQFIHWLLNMDATVLRGQLNEIRVRLQNEFHTRQNAARVATNLAINHVSWQLWVDFMLHNGVVGHAEKDDLVLEHWGYTLALAWDMIVRCEVEQNGRIFADALRHLITSKQVSIKDLEGYVAEGKPEIGYVPARDASNANIVFLSPHATWEAVQRFSQSVTIGGTVRSVGRQLMDEGYTRKNPKGEVTEVKWVGGTAVRYWAVDLGKLGIGAPHLRVVGQTSPLPLGEPKAAENVSF